MQKNNQHGFVLVYALVIMIAVMTVSATILTIYIKELKFSSIGRESTVAYYAAESGAECAFYWFLQGGDFLGTFDSDRVTYPDPGNYTIRNNAQCAGRDLNYTTYEGEDGIWRNADPGTDEVCAFVWLEPNPPTIKSRGYNTCAISDLRIERGFEITY